MRLTPLALAVFLLPCTLAAQSTSSPQDIAKSLEKHAVVLRHYYTDAKLKFDSNGQLVSPGTEGFGLSDGRLYVQEVQLSPNKLVITGTRLISVYNEEQDRWEAAETGKVTSIEVALPSGQSPESAVPQLLNSIFLKQTETALLQCSPQEIQDFNKDILSRLKGQHFESSKLPDAPNLAEIPEYCVPGGERAYRVGRGIKAPRAKHTPDPSYAESARQAKLQGTTILMTVITPAGLPSAISVVRSLGSGLNDPYRHLGQQLDWKAVEAVSKWRFEPAKFGDTPVPVVINVEVNFRLN